MLMFVAVVNPNRDSGKVTLITRYGATKVYLKVQLAVTEYLIGSLQVEQYLPSHIAAVRASGHPVIWVCDPMHGK
jgi:3-deoxy-7-phosphoheptulonate synthase